MAYFVLSNGLRGCYMPDNVSEINRRNALPEYAAACATHDFCDANMIMEEAFRQTFGRLPETNADDESDLLLWNQAWDMAKAKGFAA